MGYPGLLFTAFGIILGVCMDIKGQSRHNNRVILVLDIIISPSMGLKVVHGA